MKKTIIFFSGVFVGLVASITVMVIIGIILYNRGILLNRIYKFSDIKIMRFKDADGESLILAKGKKIFFYAETEANKPGKVTNIAIVDQNDIPRFKMTASEEEDKWENAMYYCDTPSGYTTGEEYTDINFDGQFDEKDVYDDTGELIAIFIYVNKDWKKVDEASTKEAVCGRVTYIFDANHGWMKK